MNKTNGMEESGHEDRERLSADDQAAQIAQDQLQAALDAQRRQAAAAASRHVEGICSNCEEPLPDGHFCDRHCRLDFERRERMAAITGTSLR